MQMAEKRKTCTWEFKVEAVRLLETSGKPGREIEKELDIGSGQIYRWRAQLAQEGSGIRAFPGNGKPRDEELSALRREVKDLREQRGFLRKALVVFSRPQR
jgi:transposase